jgi:hypothetical protein
LRLVTLRLLSLSLLPICVFLQIPATFSLGAFGTAFRCGLFVPALLPAFLFSPGVIKAFTVVPVVTLVTTVTALVVAVATITLEGSFAVAVVRIVSVPTHLVPPLL